MQVKLNHTLLAALLAGLTMLGPFSIDTYLPAFPAIQASLDASALEVQQTLTAYLLAFAVMTLWHGALSDAFGRRNVILVGLVVFAIASFGCAAAHSIPYLWGFRILQGISAGAGMVVGRALIRDLYQGPEAERMLSLATMIFSVAPAIAPVVGGLVVTYLSWRAIFLLLVLYTVLLWLVCYRYLPESLPVSQRQVFSVDFLWRSYNRVFRSSEFYMKSSAVGFNFGGLFLYVTSAPAFITQHLQLGATSFAWQFVPTVLGIFFGAGFANRLAGRMSIWQQANWGYACMALAVVFNLLFHIFHAPSLWFSVSPLFLYSLGMAIVQPGATLLVLDLFPEIRGTVASCQSALATLMAAAVAGILAPALDFSVLSLAAGQAGLCGLGACMWYGSRYYARQKLATG